MRRFVRLSKAQWLGIARHVLGALGGIAVTIGLINAEQVATLTGAVMSILAVVLSVKAPEKLVSAEEEA